MKFIIITPNSVLLTSCNRMKKITCLVMKPFFLDGLPLFKASGASFWPLLVSVKNLS